MLLSIDPSIRALGWAVFDHRSATGDASLVAYGLQSQSAKQDGDFVVRSDASAKAMVDLAVGWKVTRALIEQPSHYSGSAESEAARNSGDILALMFQVATIRAHLLARRIEVILVPVTKWKGTTPKHVTQQRIKTHWGFEDEDHNVCDAVGIGDFYLRKMLGFRPVLLPPARARAIKAN